MSSGMWVFASLQRWPISPLQSSSDLPTPLVKCNARHMPIRVRGVVWCGCGRVGVGVCVGVWAWMWVCGCGCVGVGVGIHTYIPPFSPGLLKISPPPITETVLTKCHSHSLSLHVYINIRSLICLIFCLIYSLTPSLTPPLYVPVSIPGY